MESNGCDDVDGRAVNRGCEKETWGEMEESSTDYQEDQQDEEEVLNEVLWEKNRREELEDEACRVWGR